MKLQKDETKARDNCDWPYDRLMHNDEWTKLHRIQTMQHSDTQVRSYIYVILPNYN